MIILKPLFTNFGNMAWISILLKYKFFIKSENITCTKLHLILKYLIYVFLGIHILIIHINCSTNFNINPYHKYHNINEYTNKWLNYDMCNVIRMKLSPILFLTYLCHYYHTKSFGLITLKNTVPLFRCPVNTSFDPVNFVQPLLEKQKCLVLWNSST